MGQVQEIRKRFRGDWGKRLQMFDNLIWTVISTEIWEWKERKGIESLEERYLRQVFGVESKRRQDI